MIVLGVCGRGAGGPAGPGEEVLLAAAELAGRQGCQVRAACLWSDPTGPDAGQCEAERAHLASLGYERAVLAVPGDHGPAPGPAGLAWLAAHVVELPGPVVLVLPGDADWRAGGARLAVRLGWPVAGDVVAFGPAGDITRILFGGNVLAQEGIEAPGILCVRPGAFRRGSPDPGPAAPAAASSCELRVMAPPAPLPDVGAVTVLGVEARAGEGPPLEDAGVVVAGGRGIGGPEGFSLLRALARALGGAVGASRAAVDLGWAPYELQVGQSGRTVSPRLYLALGISGAPQHLAGVTGSRCTVAVNRDPGAPIFSHCSYGVVADWREFAVALLSELGQEQPRGRNLAPTKP